MYIKLLDLKKTYVTLHQVGRILNVLVIGYYNEKIILDYILWTMRSQQFCNLMIPGKPLCLEDTKGENISTVATLNYQNYMRNSNKFHRSPIQISI